MVAANFAPLLAMRAQAGFLVMRSVRPPLRPLPLSPSPCTSAVRVRLALGSAAMREDPCGSPCPGDPSTATRGRAGLEDLNQLISMYREGTPHEVLVATYLKKKAAKELPVSGNPTEIQIKIDEAKLLEWNTILAKHAARLVLGPEAEGVRKRHSDRIMGIVDTSSR